MYIFMCFMNTGNINKINEKCEITLLAAKEQDREIILDVY